MFMTRPPLDVPVNLAEWIAPEKLAEWIAEAIQGLDCSRPAVVKFLQHPPDQRAETILALLVLCYLTQRFDGREIFRACQSDPLLKRLCGDKAPAPDEFGHFRRQHREVLKFVLGRVLIRAVQEKFPDAGRVPRGLEHGLFMHAIDQLDTARHMSNSDE
jgi:transposase